MKVEIVTSPDEAKRLWEKFSPKETIWENYDAAHTFFNPKNCETKFLVLKEDDGSEHGLLPLWYEKPFNACYLPGSTFLENNKFWFEPEHFKILYDNIPRTTKLFELNHESVEKVIQVYPEFKDLFIKINLHSFLDIVEFNYNLDAYLDTFSKKHKKNFLYDLKKLEALNINVKWEKLEHFNKMKEYSVHRFSHESDFADDEFVAEIYPLYDWLNKQGKLLTCAIYLNGRLEGLEIAAIHNEIYYVLNGGYNMSISNLGKFLLYQHLKKAFDLKLKKIDFLSGEEPWKKLWNLKQEVYYEAIVK